jgi:hypothetical protein
MDIMNWQWKPNQRINYYRVQRRYYGRRRSYPALATIGAILGLMIIIAALVSL